MYPNVDYNPVSNSRTSSVCSSCLHCATKALPLIAGAAGLMFAPNGLDPMGEDTTEYRVIVKLPQEPAIWLYIGQYKRIEAPSLTQSEWSYQETKVNIRN